jgi:hypothetical protein
MRKVTFIKDFATKVRGEIWECDGSLASHLVHQDQVAVYGELTTEQIASSYPSETADTNTESELSEESQTQQEQAELKTESLVDNSETAEGDKKVGKVKKKKEVK